QRDNRCPARWTHRAARRLFEKTVAGGAGGGPNDGENRVNGTADCRLQIADVVEHSRITNKSAIAQSSICIDVDAVRVAPQPLEAVEEPRFRREDVHDEIEVVEQNP